MTEAMLLRASLGGCTLEVYPSPLLPGSALSFTYRFLNRETDPAFLFNRLFLSLDGQGRPLLDPRIASIEADPGGALVSKRLTPVPAGFAVESPIIPCMTRVGPGEDFAETLTIPLPAPLVSAYLPGRRPPVVRGPMRVDFALGFFLAPAVRERLIPMVDTNLGPALQLQAFTESAQRILRVGPLTDRFEFRR